VAVTLEDERDMHVVVVAAFDDDEVIDDVTVAADSRVRQSDEVALSRLPLLLVVVEDWNLTSVDDVIDDVVVEDFRSSTLQLLLLLSHCKSLGTEKQCCKACKSPGRFLNFLDSIEGNDRFRITGIVVGKNECFFLLFCFCGKNIQCSSFFLM